MLSHYHSEEVFLVYKASDKSCKKGWRGDKCNMRGDSVKIFQNQKTSILNFKSDCNVSNGDCGELICKEMTVNDELFSECVCRSQKEYRSKQWTCLGKYSLLNCSNILLFIQINLYSTFYNKLAVNYKLNIKVEHSKCKNQHKNMNIEEINDYN